MPVAAIANRKQNPNNVDSENKAAPGVETISSEKPPEPKQPNNIEKTLKDRFDAQGRFGQLQDSQGAYAAAMDGGGGYEFHAESRPAIDSAELMQALSKTLKDINLSDFSLPKSGK